MFSFTAILGTFALLSSFALADNLFAGCYASLPSTVTGPSSAPALRRSSAHCSVGLSTLRSSLTNKAGCTSNTHSYFNATSGQCFCSNGTPYSDSLRLGNQDSCGLYYDNRNIRTSHMSLNPQCYANKPAGITDANTKAYTGLNSCLNSCKNGLRATYWARNMVSRLKWSWTGCIADLLGRKCNSHLSVLVCDAFELWCWHNMWSGHLLCKSRLFSAV